MLNLVIGVKDDKWKGKEFIAACPIMRQRQTTGGWMIIKTALSEAILHGSKVCESTYL